MTTTHIGLELHQYRPAPDVMDEVRLSEKLGYDSVWFGDSQMIWRDLYVLMGAAAVAT